MKLRAFLAAAACAVSACAYVEATTTQYVGVPRFAAGDPAGVQVLPAEPMRPHDRLGEILLDISVDPPAPMADIERKLREEAAKWGASAVFVVRDRVVPGERRNLIGVAIRYR
jgi:hypothetical protein